MKIKPLILFVIVIPFLTPVSGLQEDNPQDSISVAVSYPVNEFYVMMNESDTVSFSRPSFVFSVPVKILLYNTTEDMLFKVKPIGEVMKFSDWKQYFTFSFDKSEVDILVPASGIGQSILFNQTIIFYPTVTFNVSLSHSYDLHFVFTVDNKMSGNRIIGSAGGSAILHINADIPASRLKIKTLGQGGSQRGSTIEIKFSKDEPRGHSAFTTVYDVSYYTDIVPNGYYWIRTTDSQTGIYNITTLHIESAYYLNVTYKIIAFLPFAPLAPRTQHGDLVVNYTVINEYKLLYDVTIRLWILNPDGKIVKDSDVTNPIPEFQRGLYKRTLNVTGVTWTTGYYLIQGFIYVEDKLYLSQNASFDLNFFIINEIINEVWFNPWTPFFLVGFGGLSVGIIIMSVREKRKKKVIDVEENITN